MASTATAVVAKFRTRYPDCDTTTASDYLQDVLKEIYSRIEVRTTEVTVNMTDGTREYDLNVNVTGILEVIYKPTSDETGWIVLEATNVDKEDATDPYWRTDLTEGTPYKYYIRGVTDTDTAKNVIGFIEIPPTTTSAGYPIVAIQCSQYAALTTSETMPSNLLNDNVLLYGMRYYFAIDRGLPDKEITKWYSLYEQELQKNATHVRNLPGDDDPTYIFSPVFTLTKSV